MAAPRTVTNSANYTHSPESGAGAGRAPHCEWPATIPSYHSSVQVLQAPLQRSYQIPGYHDYAGVQEESSLTTPLLTTPFHLANRCKSSDLVFPQKVHMLLTAAEQDKELESIVSWKVHGRAFAVHNRKRFVKEVLPEWFLQSQFESFQRQLNLYGFRRITTGPDRGASYHELFLRQKPFLAARIQRLRLKGTGPRKPAQPELEPNFYRMAVLPTHEMVKNQTSYATRNHCANPLPVGQAFLNTVAQMQTGNAQAIIVPKPPTVASAPAHWHPNGLVKMIYAPYAKSISISKDSSKPSLMRTPLSPGPNSVQHRALVYAASLAPVPSCPKEQRLPVEAKAPLSTNIAVPKTCAPVQAPAAPRRVSRVSLQGSQTCTSHLTVQQERGEPQSFSSTTVASVIAPDEYETRGAALTMMETAPPPEVEEASDEDFALILAELAAGKFAP